MILNIEYKNTVYCGSSSLVVLCVSPCYSLFVEFVIVRARAAAEGCGGIYHTYTQEQVRTNKFTSPTPISISYFYASATAVHCVRG